MARRDVRNGTNLGVEMDWDNDPCKKIVDQLYRVEVGDEIPDEACTQLISFLEKYQALGFDTGWEINYVIQKDFTSPLECMEFIESLEQSLEISLKQRKCAVMGGEYWEDLQKEDLEKILTGKKEPYYSLVPQYNPRFNPCVDIGD